MLDFDSLANAKELLFILIIYTKLIIIYDLMLSLLPIYLMF